MPPPAVGGEFRLQKEVLPQHAEQSRSVLELVVQSAWVHDLPVCFPGRQCVDETPFGARVLSLLSALTPASSAIAAGCFTVLGAALVLVVLGLRMQWRGLGVRPWFAVLITAILLGGAVIGQAIAGWFAAISAIYSNIYGQPSAAPPSSLTASWPAVGSAGHAMVALAVLAVIVALNTTVVRRRRDDRVRRSAVDRGGDEQL